MNAMHARLELLRRRLGHSGPVRAGVPPRPHADTAPLSASQHRMWLHQELHPASGAYNVCIRIDLAGELDHRRLLDALAAVVDRHEVLRTTYPKGANGQPYQRIHRHLPPPVHILDGGDPDAVAQAAAGEPFDIASASPIRVHLMQTAADRWSLVLTVHHIVWDGGCFGVFSRDLSAAYRGRDVPPLTVQYADIAAHQARPDAVSPARGDGQLDHWRRTLTPLPPVPPLPVARPFGADAGERATRLDRVMTPPCALRLRNAAATLRTTPFAVFIAAYALLLARWTGTDDITIGTMVANRHLPGSGELIGNFGNTVLLRLRLGGDPSFRAFLAHAGQVIADALGNADVPFERIVADRAPPREAGHGFFTDTLGLFLDRDIAGPDLPGVAVRWSNIFNGASPFALTFQGFLTGDTLRVEATFRDALFDPGTVSRMLDHLEAILLTGTARPDERCSTVGALPPAQRDALIRLGAGPDAAPPTISIPALWRRRVATTPTRTAVIHDGRRFSYADIDQRANRLAERMAARGVGVSDVVAVALGRSVTALAALLAIWKCGAVHLPLDRSHPTSRLHDLLAAANARLVIGEAGFDAGHVESLAADHTAPPPSADPGYEPHPADAAHIGFTSGSTGRPKGVVIPHASLAARTSWVADHWPGGAGGARLGKTAPTAIDAIAEFCESVATGDCLVLATDSEARDAAALARLLDTHGIGHVMAVPGLIEAAAIAAPAVIGTRDRVLATGEPLLPGVARALHRAAPTVSLFNSYGCTETTGDVAAGRVDAVDAENGVTPIGAPLPGSRCHVLSSDLTPAPWGALGELYVEGPQLARGYLAEPALTATRFIASPFNPGARLYRTGDLARWRDDGRLELAGRSDDQVNVRGHRVEPAETVAALHAIPGVREAAVLPRPAGSTIELVAYVAGDGLGAADGQRLRQRLAATLPGPLVPAAVVVLPRLPRLDGGKIDRRALARHEEPSHGAPAAAGRPPRNAPETTLVRLLGEVLGLAEVSIDDDFFSLGGDSLRAVSFAARAAAAGLAFPAAAVFQFPTVALLAQNLTPPPAPAEPKAASLSLPAQTHRFRLSGLPVNEFVTWESLPGPLDPLRLRHALEETVARHDALQTAIAARGRLWRASRPPSPCHAPSVINIAPSERANAVGIGRSAIDIAAGRALAAVVAGESALLVAHPAVVDGLSLRRIAGEIAARLGVGDDAPLPSDDRGAPVRSPSFWEEIMNAGPESPWWVGPEEAPPPPACHRMRVTADGAAGAAKITAAFLDAARALSGKAAVVADIEIDGDGTAAGPLLTVPVSVRAGAEPLAGDAASHAAFSSSRRPAAGGPGVLLRRTTTPEEWPADGTARGADRLYHLVGSWQRRGHRTALEVAAGDPGLARDMAAAWLAALCVRGTGDA